MAGVFAVMVIILLSTGAIAVQVRSEQRIYPGYKAGGVHWRSFAAQTIPKAVIYHGAGFELLENKNRDNFSRLSGKQLTHSIVRVSQCILLACCNYFQLTFYY
jgi:hypothetical protein